MLFEAKSIYITNNFAWYDYYVRGGSIVTSYSIKNAKHILDNMKDLTENLLTKIEDKELLQSYKKHITRTASGVMLRARLIKKEDKPAYYNLLKEYKFLFKRGYNLKQKLVALSIKLFGFKFTTKLLSVI